MAPQGIGACSVNCRAFRLAAASTQDRAGADMRVYQVRPRLIRFFGSRFAGAGAGVSSASCAIRRAFSRADFSRVASDSCWMRVIADPFSWRSAGAPNTRSARARTFSFMIVSLSREPAATVNIGRQVASEQRRTFAGIHACRGAASDARAGRQAIKKRPGEPDLPHRSQALPVHPWSARRSKFLRQPAGYRPTNGRCGGR